MARALLRAAPILRLTRMTQRRVCAVLEQDIGPGLVVEHTAETITEAGRREVRCDAGFVDDVDVRAGFDQYLQHSVPVSIARAEERVLVVGRRRFRVDTEIEQEPDCRERAILIVDDFSDAPV